MVLAVLGLTGAMLAAQTPPAAKPPAAPPAEAAKPAGDSAPAADQKPTFQVQVNYVTTDVIARDGKGQFLPDLGKDELEIYEDGVKQEVAALTLVHGGRVYNLQAPPPPAAEEGIILPPQRPQADTAGRIFLLFVDDLHLDFRNTGRIRQLFQKIANTLIHEGDMFGIVSTGPSSIAIDMTYDRKRLDEAIKKISGSGLKPADIIGGPGRRRRAHGSALPRARGVLDRQRHRREPRQDPEPPQGRRLRQQRLRLQPVRRSTQGRGELQR